MSEELEFDLTLYPEPVLRKEAAPVEAFDDDLAATVAAMYRRMYASKGVGLAAPQVGIKQRILVINPSGEAEQEGEELTLVNPRITERSRETIDWRETCLSVPDLEVKVKRAKRITVEWQDPADGTPRSQRFEDFESVIVQHELDHLIGTVLLDRVSGFKRSRWVKKRKRAKPTS